MDASQYKDYLLVLLFIKYISDKYEMVHLLERSHNATFISLMDKFMPQWRHIRDELNRAPLGHVDWEY